MVMGAGESSPLFAIHRSRASEVSQHVVMRCRAPRDPSRRALPCCFWIPAQRSTAPRCTASGTRERALRHALQKRLFRRTHRIGRADMHPDAVEA